MTALRRLAGSDNVAVALTAVPARTRCTVGDTAVTASRTIPAGHKIALIDISAGSPVVKYGSVIGLAAQPIAAGDHVHVHNVGVPDGPVDASATGLAAEHRAAPAQLAGPALFAGFRRASGAVGTRNYIGIIPTVNCSSTVGQLLCSGEAAGPPVCRG